MRHVDARYLDAGIQLSKAIAFERILAAQLARLAGHFSRRINAKLKNEPLIGWPFSVSSSLSFSPSLVWRFRDEVTRDLLIPGLDLFAWPARVRGGNDQPGSRFSNRVSEFLIGACDKASKEDDKVRIQVCILFESVDLWPCYLRTSRFHQCGEPPWISPLPCRPRRRRADRSLFEML